MSHLTTEEAMSDAAAFLTHLRGGLEARLPAVAAVVGFGGSYGGMMAAWFRVQVALDCHALVLSSHKSGTAADRRVLYSIRTSSTAW